MRFHGLCADAKAGANFRRGQAFAEQLEDFELTVAELLDLGMLAGMRVS